jgi:manganese/zinc/iron transport system substrate-binding protein
MPKSSRRPRSRSVHLAAWAVAAAAFGCGAPADAPPDAGAGAGDRLRVVTTIGMIADAARAVAGAHADVESLMQTGVDPHLYKASESDVRKLAEADLILYNGLHLEGKMGDVLVKMARTRPVVAVSEEIPAELLREPPEFLGQYDPHIWFDVSLWRRTLPPIVRELSALDPAHGAEFAAAAEAYGAELDRLDGEVERRIAELPPERRLLVTAHDAFGYFGRRYGVEVVGLQGISTVSEAGLRDVERVVDLVVARRVPAIFIESSVPRRSIEAVVAAVRDRGHEVEIGGTLYSDSMGPAGTPDGTYVGMVRHNVDTLVAALKEE